MAHLSQGEVIEGNEDGETDHAFIEYVRLFCMSVFRDRDTIAVDFPSHFLPGHNPYQPEIVCNWAYIAGWRGEAG